MPSDFLLDFHRQHFAGASVLVYSKQVFYALLDALEKLRRREDDARQQ